MKAFHSILPLFLSAIMLAGVAPMPVNGLDAIAGYIGAGNAKGLSTHFDSFVQLTIDGREGTYSRKQAEAIMRDFFRQYPPKQFVIDHASDAGDGLTRYAIGTYVSGSKKFRTYVYLNKKGESLYIQELSFQYD